MEAEEVAEKHKSKGWVKQGGAGGPSPGWSHAWLKGHGIIIGSPHPAAVCNLGRLACVENELAARCLSVCLFLSCCW